MKYVLRVSCAMAIFSQEEEKEQNLTHRRYEILILFNLVNIQGVVQHKWRMVLIREMVQDFTFGDGSTFYSTRLCLVE